MPSRAPTPSDFPSTFTLSITPPPSTSPRPTNVLILLHGLGDTHNSFTSLGRQLNLPETVCISLQAPSPVPFDLEGFHWGDDIQFSESGQQPLEYDTGFTKSTKLVLEDVVQGVLVQKCGYRYRDVLLFGLGQGGMAALAVAAALGTTPASASELQKELGGVVSLGGVVPEESTGQALGTPVLVVGGERETLVTRTGLERTKRIFKNVEYNKWGRQGDGMPRDKEEMMPVMKFFARRLKSRQGVPEGAVEVG